MVSKELNEQQRSNSVRREVMKRSLHSGGSQRRARTRTANEGGKPGRGCAAETKAASMLIQIFCKTNIFLSHKTPSRARFFENSSFCSSVGYLNEGFMTSSLAFCSWPLLLSVARRPFTQIKHVFLFGFSTAPRASRQKGVKSKGEKIR